MPEQLYRDTSLKHISSPEQLNDYLKVTKRSVWAILAAVIILMVGLFIWGSFAYISSSISGVAEVEDGTLIMDFDSQEYASNIREGMTIRIGEYESQIYSVGKDDAGYIFALAETELEDGYYDATVTYKETQVLRLLFGK